MLQTAPFDAIAPAYDAQFTHSFLGGYHRRAVWRWLDRAFAPGQRVLELGCGTGEDAAHLAGRGVRVLATDPSDAMLAVARAKLAAAGLAASVELRPLAIERLDALAAERAGAFDGAFSSFGSFNCVADLPRAARALSVLLPPGARLVLGIMGPLVPWEWVWLLAHGRVRHAFRRLAPGGAQWRGLTVRYPSIRTVRRAFAAEFAVRGVGALGVLLPPPYADAWARPHTRLVARLDRWERRVERWPMLAWLGDHYLMELERR